MENIEARGPSKKFGPKLLDVLAWILTPFFSISDRLEEAFEDRAKNDERLIDVAQLIMSILYVGYLVFMYLVLVVWR